MDENILARVQTLAELGNKNGEQCSLLGATPGWSVNNVLSWVPPLILLKPCSFNTDIEHCSALEKWSGCNLLLLLLYSTVL